MKKKNLLFVVLMLTLAISVAGCGSGSRGNAGERTQEQEQTREQEQAQIQNQEQAQDQIQVNKDAVHIRTSEDLLAFAERVNSGETELDAVLDADIDLASMCSAEDGSWTPMNQYAGTFEGGGHSIKNLYIQTTAKGNIGFFSSCAQGSAVQNLTLENVWIDGGHYTGAVSGRTEGAIRHCQVSGTVKGYYTVGGIVGSMEHSSDGADGEPDGGLEGCVNLADVSGEEMERNGAVGGIVGWTDMPVKGCRNSGFISGAPGFTGGIVGEAEGTYREEAGRFVRIENCENNGGVEGILFVGGILGYGSDSMLTNCKNTEDVTGFLYVGGICGVVKGAGKKGEFVSMIANCVNTGDVKLFQMESGGSIKYERKKGGPLYYNDQLIGGIAAAAEGGIVLNCRNGGNLICDTNKYRAECGAVHIAAWMGGDHNLVLNCVSTATITAPKVETEDFLQKGVSVVGIASDQAIAVYYTGEQCDDEIVPVGEESLMDGSVVASLNAFPEGISDELLNRLRESGIEYELSSWKQGENGPVLEWEE